MGNVFESVVGQGVALFKVQVLKLIKLSDYFLNMGIIELDEPGQFEFFQIFNFIACHLNGLQVEFLTAAEEQSTNVILVISQQHSDFPVSNVLCAGEMSQVGQLIDVQVDTNAAAYLQPFYKQLW